jgi:ATP-dependent RNA helicase DeaD
VYTHRTGRTGRAGKSGTAISLVSGLDIGNFRSLQKVNRIVIPERKLPGEAEVAKREAERLGVDIEHHLRDIPVADRPVREETHLATVESLSATPEGRRLLSAVLFEYLEHRHVSTPVNDEKSVPVERAAARAESGERPAPGERAGSRAERSESRAPESRERGGDAPAGDDRPDPARPRRRRRRGGGGGGERGSR